MQRRMLEKWQVPKKYYDMIEDMFYSKEEGYFIYLKDGFTNDDLWSVPFGVAYIRFYVL